MFFINCENSHLITLLIAQKIFLVKIDARAGWGLYLEIRTQHSRLSKKSTRLIVYKPVQMGFPSKSNIVSHLKKELF